MHLNMNIHMTLIKKNNLKIPKLWYRTVRKIASKKPCFAHV